MFGAVLLAPKEKRVQAADCMLFRISLDGLMLAYFAICHDHTMDAEIRLSPKALPGGYHSA